MKHAAHAARAAHAAAAHVSRVSSKRVPHTTHKPTEEPSNVVFGYKPDPKKGELAVYGNKYFETPGDMPRKSDLENVVDGLNNEFENPVQMFGAFTAAHDAAKKAQYNEQLHNSLQNRTPGYQAKFAHFTPSVAGQGSMYRSDPPNFVYSTPYGASSDLQSPPPPTDLSVHGTGLLPYNSMGFAPGAPGAGVNPTNRDLRGELDMLPAPLPPSPSAAPFLSPPRSKCTSSIIAPNTIG